MMSRPMENLCRFVSEIGFEEIDPKVLSHARLVLVDTLGVIIAGSGEREVSELLGKLQDEGRGVGGASCLGRSEQASSLNAAMVNGVAGSSLEFEEGNSRAMGHPAIQVIPAVVAECERRKASGKDLLAGLIAGYESGARVSKASALRKGLHPTGTWGTVGAALGVGRIYGRRPDELCQIANISASFALSPYVKNSFVGKKIASTFAGLTNYLGLLSNIFFDSGIRADESSLRMTFSQFVSDRFDESSLDRGLGQDYFIVENYFKPYPSCRFTHPAIDAMKAILGESSFQPEEVENVSVETFKAAMDSEGKPPSNLEAARFSVPYLLGILIVLGDVSLEVMREVRLEDRRLTFLVERIKMKVAPPYEALRPRHYPTRVTVRLKDGRELTREVMNPRGDSLNPLDEQSILRKFVALTAPVIGKDRAETFCERAAHLEKEENVEHVIGLLRRPCQSMD